MTFFGLFQVHLFFHEYSVGLFQLRPRKQCDHAGSNIGVGVGHACRTSHGQFYGVSIATAPNSREEQKHPSKWGVIIKSGAKMDMGDLDGALEDCNEVVPAQPQHPPQGVL
eukprot:5943869-Amphidinium_carterae.1